MVNKAEIKVILGQNPPTYGGPFEVDGKRYVKVDVTALSRAQQVKLFAIFNELYGMTFEDTMNELRNVLMIEYFPVEQYELDNYDMKPWIIVGVLSFIALVLVIGIVLLQTR